MQYTQEPSAKTPEQPDAPHRITLLMIIVLLLIPLSGASYTLAVIAIIKGNFGVVETSQTVAKLWGFGSAALITLYLGLHWYVIVRYYQEITKQLFGIKNFIQLYGLLLVNLTVFALTLSIDLYHLPIYMIPAILSGINGYLIYLRRCALTGKPLR